MLNIVVIYQIESAYRGPSNDGVVTILIDTDSRIRTKSQ
jgi:hypothetical protein